MDGGLRRMLHSPQRRPVPLKGRRFNRRGLAHERHAGNKCTLVLFYNKYWYVTSALDRPVQAYICQLFSSTKTKTKILKISKYRNYQLVMAGTNFNFCAGVKNSLFTASRVYFVLYFIFCSVLLCSLLYYIVLYCTLCHFVLCCIVL